MPAPRISERSAGPISLRRGTPWSAHFQDARRYPPDHGKVGNIPDHYGVRANDDVITYTHPPENFRPGTELDTVADRGRTQRIVETGIAESHTVTDQTIIADYGRPVYDDTAMMFDGQASADSRGCADTDSTENLDELVEYDVSDRPGRTHDLVADYEAGVTEAIYQQCPEADAQQSFPLRFEVFQQVHHRDQDTDCGVQSSTAGSYAIVAGTATECRPVYNDVKPPVPGQLSLVQG